MAKVDPFRSDNPTNPGRPPQPLPVRPRKGNPRKARPDGKGQASPASGRNAASRPDSPCGGVRWSVSDPNPDTYAYPNARRLRLRLRLRLR